MPIVVQHEPSPAAEFDLAQATGVGQFRERRRQEDIQWRNLNAEMQFREKQNFLNRAADFEKQKRLFDFQEKRGVVKDEAEEKKVLQNQDFLLKKMREENELKAKSWAVRDAAQSERTQGNVVFNEMDDDHRTWMTGLNTGRFSPEGKQVLKTHKDRLAAIEKEYNGGDGNLAFEEYQRQRTKEQRRGMREIADQFVQPPGTMRGDVKHFGGVQYTDPETGKEYNIGSNMKVLGPDMKWTDAGPPPPVPEKILRAAGLFDDWKDQNGNIIGTKSWNFKRQQWDFNEIQKGFSRVDAMSAAREHLGDDADQWQVEEEAIREMELRGGNPEMVSRWKRNYGEREFTRIRRIVEKAESAGVAALEESVRTGEVEITEKTWNRATHEQKVTLARSLHLITVDEEEAEYNTSMERLDEIRQFLEQQQAMGDAGGAEVAPPEAGGQAGGPPPGMDGGQAGGPPPGMDGPPPGMDGPPPGMDRPPPRVPHREGQDWADPSVKFVWPNGNTYKYGKTPGGQKLNFKNAKKQDDQYRADRGLGEAHNRFQAQVEVLVRHWGGKDNMPAGQREMYERLMKKDRDALMEEQDKLNEELTSRSQRGQRPAEQDVMRDPRLDVQRELPPPRDLGPVTPESEAEDTEELKQVLQQIPLSDLTPVPLEAGEGDVRIDGNALIIDLPGVDEIIFAGNSRRELLESVKKYWRELNQRKRDQQGEESPGGADEGPGRASLSELLEGAGFDPESPRSGTRKTREQNKLARLASE